jgi:hypothetical protein
VSCHGAVIFVFRSDVNVPVSSVVLTPTSNFQLGGRRSYTQNPRH